MSYLIQTVLNVAAFIVASVVVNLAMWYMFIETEVVTLVMNLDTLKSFKKGDKINVDYKNAFVVKHKEGALCYKLASKVVEDAEDECDECESDAHCEEEVATETKPKTEETAGE